MPKKKFIQPAPSPIEIMFWDDASSRIPNLKREVWIDNKYRVDFCIPDAKVIIELYGYKYHNEKWKITKDAQRERYLQKKGYQILRFTGSEITKDVHSCVNEVIAILNSHPKEKTPEKAVVRSIPSAIPISFPNTSQVENRKPKVLGMENWQILILSGLVIAILVVVVLLAYLVIHSA